MRSCSDEDMSECFLGKTFGSVGHMQEKKNRTDRQPWIAACNNTAAFSTENTTFKAFDRILKGPFLSAGGGVHTENI